MSAGGDKLFKRRQAKNNKDFARKGETRKVKRRVLIVCEGEKTEPLYLRSLVSHFGLTTAEIYISGEGGSAPKSVVSHGKKILADDSDFEIVLFVFDRDQHTDYDAAIGQVYDHQVIY